MFRKSKKDIKYHISKITAKDTSQWLLLRLKHVGRIQVPVETSLRRVKLVSLTQVLVDTSLRRLKLVGFIYVPVRRRKNVSNRFDLLAYQLRRRDDASAWSWTWSGKWFNFFWIIGSMFFGIYGDSVSLRYQLVRLYNVSKTQVSFRYQL